MTEMIRDLELYVAGEWLGAQGRRIEEVINPATGETIARLPHATQADLDRALTAAGAAFDRWKDVSVYERAKILRQAAGLLRERIEALALAMTLEQGKTIGESRIELMGAADIFEATAEEACRAYGRIVPTRQSGWRQTVLKQPIGVVAAFTPWNFPALIPARKIASSLAAGCTCIIKPSEETPATTLALAAALHDAGLPAGVLNVVCGIPAEVSAQLIASPVVRKVSFTGSVPVGRHIAALAAAGVKRCTLELGGHAPVLVFGDANLDAAVRLSVASKFRNAGQVCVSPTRFLIERSVYGKFTDAFVEAVRALRCGPGTDPQSQMGPLINARRVSAMQKLIADARERGATVAIGGEAPTRSGFFHQPTVLTDLPDDAQIMHDEPFGPVALMIPFDTEAEALRRANELPFGLAAYLFTTNADRVIRLSEQIESGMLGVNTFQIATPETPFGGVKDSGYGSEGGVEGIDAYLTTKFVAQAPSS